MKKKKKHAPHEEHADESWLLPYSDLMTLLLALFIVLFASSNVDAQKYNAMASAFNEILGDKVFTQGSTGELGIPDTEGLGQENEGQEALEEIKEQLDEMFAEKGMTGNVETFIDERGLVIRMSSSVLFAPGDDTIQPEYLGEIVEIAKIIDQLNNHIRIEGHTDNVPMSNERFRSNWELSVARATSVIQLYVEDGGVSPDKLVAVGYGEYKPIADNATEIGRAQNRRVDIIVLDSKFDTLENLEEGMGKLAEHS